MNLVIKDTQTVPPEEWPYYIEATNTTITTRNFQLLYPMVKKHCESNNVTVPSQQDVIDYICRTVHVHCYEAETKVPLINKYTLGSPNPPTIGSCCSH